MKHRLAMALAAGALVAAMVPGVASAAPQGVVAVGYCGNSAGDYLLDTTVRDGIAYVKELEAACPAERQFAGFVTLFTSQGKERILFGVERPAV